MRRLAILMIMLCAGSSLHAMDTAAAVINLVNYDNPGFKNLSSSISESSLRNLPDIKSTRISKLSELNMLLYKTALQQSDDGDNKCIPEMSVHSIFSGTSVYIHSFEVGSTLFKESIARAGHYGDRLIRRGEFGVGFYYLVPLHDEVKPDMLINPFFYISTIGVIQTGLEFAFALNQRHDMELISPLNTPFTMERLYDLFMFHVCMNVLPFPQWRYVAPRIGIAVGFMNLRNYRINQVYNNDEELIINQNSFSLGGKTGLTFLPFSFFSLFFEARFYLQPSPVNRPTYVSQGLGSEMKEQSRTTRLNYFAVGGGVKIAF